MAIASADGRGQAIGADPESLAATIHRDTPNTAWVTDITYIRTWQGWLYLAVVMDLFSRQVVGWAAMPTIHRELVLNAVLMAVRRRRPRGHLIHSDQGTPVWQRRLAAILPANHLEPSMSRKGNCWDNAVAESFFSSLKKERIKKQIYKNRELAIADVADYIDAFYNPSRRHSHLGGSVPEQFEAAHKPRRKVSTKSWELQGAPHQSSGAHASDGGIQRRPGRFALTFCADPLLRFAVAVNCTDSPTNGAEPVVVTLETVGVLLGGAPADGAAGAGDEPLTSSWPVPPGWRPLIGHGALGKPRQHLMGRSCKQFAHAHEWNC